MASPVNLPNNKLTQNKLDGLLVSSDANISYLTGFESCDSYLLVSRRKNIYFTDSRYLEEARINLKNKASVVKIGASAFADIASACLRLKLKRLGFEEKGLTFFDYKKMRKALNNKVSLIPVSGLIESLRQIKNAQEIQKIEQATQITSQAFRFIEKHLQPGKKEIEVAAELERFIRYQGASNSAFRIIVASGPNSSYPHHHTSSRILRSGECVLIDAGVDYLGYKSDLTRVFFLGKIPLSFKKVYETVLRAQERAIKKIRPGIRTDCVDRAARQYIKNKGFGGFFGHSLGHGIGREVHEEPRISGKEKITLKKGMIFTIEPGIYLPHKFGVRIEDMVLVTKTGCRLLSGSLKK